MDQSLAHNSPISLGEKEVFIQLKLPDLQQISCPNEHKTYNSSVTGRTFHSLITLEKDACNNSLNSRKKARLGAPSVTSITRSE